MDWGMQGAPAIQRLGKLVGFVVVAVPGFLCCVYMQCLVGGSSCEFCVMQCLTMPGGLRQGHQVRTVRVQECEISRMNKNFVRSTESAHA